MIISLSPTTNTRGLRARVCIVGAGAAGITLACELDRCGFNVLLLEAGNLKADDAHARELYAGDAAPPHPAPFEFRRTGFGGTTRIWGGRCVPFDPIDFERRDHVSNSGWPIDYDAVATHYPRALEYCHAGRFDFSVRGSGVPGPSTIPGLAPDDPILLDRIERYSLPTHFGKEHRDLLARSTNVTVLLDARCLRLHKRAGEDAIESAEVVNRAGERHRVLADVFVLALGGIETTRMLFVSDPEANGLGNRWDRLGRFYACHLENVCAKLISGGTAPIAFNFERTSDGVYSRRKLQFTANAQREHRLLNTAFRLHFPDYSDASHGSAVMSAIYLAKSTLIPEYQAILRHGLDESTASPARAHARNVAAGLPQLSRFAATWLRRRVLARRKLPYTLIANIDGSYPLEFNAEQIPLEHSRITLGRDTDLHGVRRVSVDWRVSDDDFSAAERAFRLLRNAVARTSTAHVRFDDAELAAGVRQSVPIGGHHIGTARMASGSREGVVDGDGAVFDVPNLYVASSAVFPTSSHANPTLTIVALAIRLGALLKKRVE